MRTSRKRAELGWRASKFVACSNQGRELAALLAFGSRSAGCETGTDGERSAVRAQRLVDRVSRYIRDRGSAERVFDGGHRLIQLLVQRAKATRMRLESEGT